MARDSWETGKLDFIGVRQETSEDWAWECVCMWLRRGMATAMAMEMECQAAAAVHVINIKICKAENCESFSPFFSLARIASSLRTQHCGPMLLAHMHCKKWGHHLRATTRQELQYVLKIWNIYSYIYTSYSSLQCALGDISHKVYTF